MHPLPSPPAPVRVMGARALPAAGAPAPGFVRRRHLVLLPGGVDSPAMAAPRSVGVPAPRGPARSAAPGVAVVERPLRLTARGWGAVWLLVLSGLAGLVTALSGYLRAPAVGGADRPAGVGVPVSARTAVVGEGETLWSVAARVAPGVNTRQEVAAMREMNGLATSAVQTGQVLRVPGR